MHRPRSARAVRPSLVLAVTASLGLVVPLVGCAASAQEERIDVLASFYPLQYVAERVGGTEVRVSSLTPPAAEPHDLELSPAAVRTVGEADLVVYLSGLQAATDDAVAAQDPEHVVDSADAAGITDAAGTVADPHFWLDPLRLAAVGRAVADELTLVDPANAAAYSARADALEADLVTLDATYSQALAACSGATLVTSHEAFGYLAQRYDLVQVGISGIDPEVEPAPARLREVRDIVERDGVTTLFFEVLVSPKVTQTLAADLGVGTAVLDPLESHSPERGDYLEVMGSNLDALRRGLGCA